MKKFVWLLVAVLFAGVAAEALAQVPESGRARITDPDLLERMGFPRDATNVYRARSVDLPAKEEPDDFGVSVHYTTVAPAAFRGLASTNLEPWQYLELLSGLARTGPEIFGQAQVVLPTGARVSAVRWWGIDTNVDFDIAVFVLEFCQDPAGGPTTIIQRGAADPATSGSGGFQTGVVGGSGGYTVNNADCHYLVRVRFDATASLLTPALVLQKIRFQWRRQVSPAPAVATFGDVPTNHPFFQFVEALAASGITAGCGSGNYCPNAALTRGQMAVFLAKALGLYYD